LRIDAEVITSVLQVAKYKRGKTQVLQYFFKQVQKELDGRADGRAVGVLLQQLLSNDSQTQND